MSTKLPEVAGQLRYQQTRDRDAEKKQIGAGYVDKRHQAAEKYIQEKRKENKLSHAMSKNRTR